METVYWYPCLWSQRIQAGTQSRGSWPPSSTTSGDGQGQKIAGMHNLTMVAWLWCPFIPGGTVILGQLMTSHKSQRNWILGWIWSWKWASVSSIPIENRASRVVEITSNSKYVPLFTDCKQHWKMSENLLIVKEIPFFYWPVLQWFLSGWLIRVICV